MACLMHKELKKQGVHLYFNQEVTAVEQQGSIVCVHTAAGQTYCADLLILAIGVAPRKQPWPSQAGLQMIRKGMSFR